MPIYIFQHKKTGNIVEIFQKLSEQKTPRGYVKLITQCGVVGANSGRSDEVEESLLNDYKTYEQRHGLGSVERDLRIKTSTIKNAAKKYSNNKDLRESTIKQ